MNKNDFLSIVQHCFTAKVLKKIIKNNYDSKYKKKSESDHLNYLNRKLSNEQLKKLIFSHLHSIASETHIFHVDDHKKEFTKEKIQDTLENYNLAENLGSSGLTENVEVWPDVQRMYFFAKAKVLYYNCTKDGIAKSPIKSTTFYSPACIEFFPPRTVKYIFGKIKIRMGMHKLLDDTFIHVTKLEYKPSQISTVLNMSIISEGVESSLSSTDLTKGVKYFSENKKISATDFAWKDQNGKNNEKHWDGESTLYSYTYINNRILPSLEIHPAKWYLTDPSKGAIYQKIKDLDYLHIHPAYGIVKTGKYLEISLQSVIDELISRSH